MDALKYPEHMNRILQRIPEGWSKTIDCGPGWWQLISLCDKELSDIDNNYVILQIKEKFGGLRYYFETSDHKLREKMDSVVVRYEKACAITCEETGGHGYLMKRMGQMKTLNESFMSDGWEKVESTTK